MTYGKVPKVLRRQAEGIECAECHAVFEPSYKQAHRSLYEPEKRLFCSRVCRRSALARERHVPRRQFTCEQCGKLAETKNWDVTRRFCSMKCYTKSDELKERLRQANLDREPVNKIHRYCMWCGKEIHARNKGKRKFCSQSCYREDMAERYDRWIANPQNIHNLQGYDEFMTQTELSCLVEGCNWKGEFLGLHVRAAHGIPAREFKRAAGFNYTTGLVGIDLAKKLERRADHLVEMQAKDPSYPGQFPPDTNPDKYYSREGREHKAKSMAGNKYGIGNQGWRNRKTRNGKN